jgi:hypothetical protein
MGGGDRFVDFEERSDLHPVAGSGTGSSSPAVRSTGGPTRTSRFLRIAVDDDRPSMHHTTIGDRVLRRCMAAEGFEDELISACRTGIGDELRSITFFTDHDVEQLYLRSDLERTADLTGFAEIERAGFRADDLYRNSQLGDYRATVRMFDHGYLTRVIHGRTGVWVTTDSMSMERFEELASAVKPILAEQTGAATET